MARLVVRKANRVRAVDCGGGEGISSVPSIVRWSLGLAHRADSITDTLRASRFWRCDLPAPDFWYDDARIALLERG